MIHVVIIFDASDGILLELAQALAKGCLEAGAGVKLYRLVANGELLADSVNVPEDDGPQETQKDRSGCPVLLPKDVPMVLGQADAIVVGSPSASGRLSLSALAFLEHCSDGNLVPNGTLRGKVGAAFSSAGSRMAPVEVRADPRRLRIG